MKRFAAITAMFIMAIIIITALNQIWTVVWGLVGGPAMTMLLMVVAPTVVVYWLKH